MGRVNLSRHHKNLKTRNLYLIICEGINKTERLYFEHFKDRCNNINLRIENSKATDPQSMINKAKQLIEQLGLDEEDRIFCLIDIDNDPEKAKLVEALSNKKENKNIEIVTSNATFETWYLLHFTDTPRYLDSKNTIRELKKYIPQYDKDFDVYLKVKGINQYMDKAIYRAKKLRDYHVGLDKDLFNANPYTMVDMLVDLIIKNR